MIPESIHWRNHATSHWASRSIEALVSDIRLQHSLAVEEFLMKRGVTRENAHLGQTIYRDDGSTEFWHEEKLLGVLRWTCGGQKVEFTITEK